MAEEVSDILKLLEEGKITPAEAEARIAGRGGNGANAAGNSTDSTTSVEPAATSSLGFDGATRGESRFTLGGLGKKVTEVVQNVAGKPAKTVLCPSQQAALDGLVGAMAAGNILALWAKDGFGRSSILSELHERIGGKLLSARDFVDAMSTSHPLAMEEAF